VFRNVFNSKHSIVKYPSVYSVLDLNAQSFLTRIFRTSIVDKYHSYQLQGYLRVPRVGKATNPRTLAFVTSIVIFEPLEAIAGENETDIKHRRHPRRDSLAARRRASGGLGSGVRRQWSSSTSEFAINRNTPTRHQPCPLLSADDSLQFEHEEC